MAAPLYTTASGLLWHAGKILILTVGLPARGKTHISRALERYLRWMGVKTYVVSLGDYRRKTLGGAQSLPPDYFTLGEKTPDTMALRKRVSDGCEKLIWDFFEGGGQVVVYDANNGTHKARQSIAEKFDKEGIHVILLESICDNKEIIENNIRNVKISSPDVRVSPCPTDPTDRAPVPRMGPRQGHQRLLRPDTEQRTVVRDHHRDQLAVYPHLQRRRKDHGQ
jgi:6-phosphofructo-2-kinase/fructose-2,6-biphosphatase 4